MVANAEKESNDSHGHVTMRQYTAIFVPVREPTTWAQVLWKLTKVISTMVSNACQPKRTANYISLQWFCFTHIARARPQ